MLLASNGLPGFARLPGPTLSEGPPKTQRVHEVNWPRGFKVIVIMVQVLALGKYVIIKSLDPY